MRDGILRAAVKRIARARYAADLRLLRAARRLIDGGNDRAGR